MKRLVSFAVVLFLMSVAAFGAAPSNASLKGTYSFQLSDTHQDFWGQTLMCDDGTGTLVPQFWGGNQVSEDLVVGTMTFDGAGNATAS